MNEQYLECRQVVKIFDDFVLGPVDAQFTKGKVTGIFGPNGAGKSTLISLLLGILEKDAGEVRNSKLGCVKFC